MPTNSREYMRAYYQKRKKSISANSKRWYTSNAEYLRMLRLERKELVYSHYGKICNCCGEDNQKFLTIDHVNNDGAEDRKGMSRGGSSDRVITKIIKNNFPDTYQILCYNCNCGKARNNGSCPHLNKD